MGTILVVGATQGTGLYVVQELLRQGKSVRVLARNLDKAKTVFQSMPAVQLHQGDVTQSASLRGVFDGISAIIYTLGVTKRPASEALVKATEYDGTRDFLQSATQAGFKGQFVYMTSMGAGQRSFAGMILNLIKGKTLVWRGKTEALIRASGLPYTIVRAAVLNDTPPAKHQLVLNQEAMGASLRYKISRQDVARVLVNCLSNGQTVNTAFNIYWGVPTMDTQNSINFESLVSVR